MPRVIVRAVLMSCMAALAGCSGNAARVDIPLGDGVVLQLVRIEPGRFLMGSPKSEQEHVQQTFALPTDKNQRLEIAKLKEDLSQEVQHEVEITRAIYIGIYEVTQAQYQAVMKHNPSFYASSGAGKHLVAADTSWYPVDSVSWKDAVEFCQRLSDKHGKKFDLPTEAEWEFACRAGSTGPFAFGNSLSSRQANYAGVEQATMLVNSFPPNDFGLYDMHGNVAEWCKDWYGLDYYRLLSPREDPQGPVAGTHRVLRGGSWSDAPAFCRSAARDFDEPEKTNNRFGFRVVLRP